MDTGKGMKLKMTGSNKWKNEVNVSCQKWRPQLMKQRRKQTFGQNVCEVSVFILYRRKSMSYITAWNRWWHDDDDDDDDFSNVTFTERATCPAYLKWQTPTHHLSTLLLYDFLSTYHRLTYFLFILFIAISTPTRFQLDGKLHQGRDEMNCINCGIKEEKATWES